MNTKQKKIWLAWTLPLLFLAVLIALSHLFDLPISRSFYREQQFSSHPAFLWLYRYGEMPALIAGIASALFLLFSWLTKRGKSARPAALVLLLTLGIGPGLLTNVLFKQHWGRPRPRELKEFGGSFDYRPCYKPDLHWGMPERRSFPSGHATMGFFWFSLVMIGWQEKRKWLLRLGWPLALGMGIALSFTRIAQGAHFFSDTAFAAIIMWWTALAVTSLVYSGKR